MFPDKIVIHHSKTKDSGTVSWGAIRRYHMTPESAGGPKGGPWIDVGYHAGVELVGEYYEVFMGRLWTVRGAHEPKVNASSLGICFVGDFDEAEPTDGQLIAGAKWVRYWMDIFRIPMANVFGHRDFRPDKSCPGKKFSLDRFREIL